MPVRTAGGGGIGTGVVALMATVLVGWLSPIAHGAYPGADGRIAYAGHIGFTTPDEIYAIRPDGSGLEQLTDTASAEWSPAWSASGRRLAFTRGTALYSRQVYTVGARGQNETRITHDNGDDNSPSFSPNGRRIAYSKDNLSTVGPDNPRRVSIFTIRTDGTDKRLLVQGGSAGSPQYSPDDHRLVFHGRPQGRAKWGIWTVRSDGTRLRRLTDPGRTGDYDETPDWSPDGRQIAFLRCDQNSVHGCDGSVYRMRADGSHERPVRLIAGEVAPAYAPSGGKIVLTAFLSEDVCSDLYTMSLAGSTQGYVTGNCDEPSEGRTATQPSWQPLVGR